VNEAYDGFGATYDLYFEEYGRNSLDDQSMLLIGSVHFGQSFNNTYFDGTQMVFGDGDGDLFTGFTKTLDVIGQELTHGVVQHTSALEYEFQSGALNESFADVFDSLVKQRSLNQSAQDADWLIGAEIFTPAIQGDALRSMKDPGSAFDGDPQPGHMRDFKELPIKNDNGGLVRRPGDGRHGPTTCVLLSGDSSGWPRIP
jgi:Zn-dependent metalloprotease